MKKILLQIMSYLMVAVLASTLTFCWCRYLNQGKLEGLQSVLDYYFIGEIDEKKLEDAAAEAMVAAAENSEYMKVITKSNRRNELWH